MKLTAFRDGRAAATGRDFITSAAAGKTVATRGGRTATVKKFPGFLKICFLISITFALTGCGIHYYDARTGVEHVWGFGHLQMRVLPPTNGIQAVVKGYSIIGAKVGGSPDDYGVSLGYDSRRMIYVSPENALFDLSWPDASFFNVRVGTNFPAAPATASRTPQKN